MSGRVWCFGDDINTDVIMPGHALLGPVEDQRRYAFEANRPGWVDDVQPGDIIVAGQNFGTGSARPAARVLRDVGIAGVIAESINGLFFRNCVNYAFPAIECPGVQAVFEEGDEAALDLETGAVENVTRSLTLPGRAWAAELLEIQRAGGLIERLRAEGLLTE